MLLHCKKKYVLPLLTAVLFAFIACSKVEPIVPEEQKPAAEETPTPPSPLEDAPWITIQAGSHSLTNENESQIATHDIMGYINSIAMLEEKSPQYTHIRQDVFDCFNVLQHVKLTLKKDGSAILEAMPGFEKSINGKWESQDDAITLTLEAIPTTASASVYTKQFAEHFGGKTVQFKKDHSTIKTLITGHFVCDPIVEYAKKEGMSSAKPLEAFSNVFEGFDLILAQTLSNTSPADPPAPPTPPAPPAKQEIAYAWRVVKAGSRDVTSEEKIIAGANKTMGPINLFCTHLKEGSAEYNAFRDEVAKCYRLFGEMQFTLYKNGKATLDGPSGFNAPAEGIWEQLGDGSISIQITSFPLKKTANRFEQRLANDFLASPIQVKYNQRMENRTWHIPGPFVIEPCADYVKENGLSGYIGIMAFSKIFKGFDLLFADR